MDHERPYSIVNLQHDVWSCLCYAGLLVQSANCGSGSHDDNWNGGKALFVPSLFLSTPAHTALQCPCLDPKAEGAVTK